MVTRQDPLHPMGPLWACSYSDRKNWEKDHQRHLGAIKDMKGCLDHKPPWRDDRLFDNLKRAKKWYEADRGAEIARENKLLVDKLYTISKNSYVNQQAIRRGDVVSAPGVRALPGTDVRTGGKVHDALRRRNAETIEMDNEMLVNRILNVKKTINTKSFEKDFKVHKHYSALRSNMPKDMSRMHKSSSAPDLQKPKPTGDGTRGFLIPGDLAPKKPQLAASSSGEAEVGGPPRDGAIFLPSLTGP